MAAFGRVCLSMAFTGPLIYPTLCSRHRLLWSSLHRQGCVAFSCSSHRSKKKSVGTSKGVTSARKILPNATDSKENNNAGLPEASMAVMEEVVAESTVNEDLIKLRFPSKTTKELSFEKQPHRPRSSVMFTIGKEAVTLETAEAAVAKRRSLHNESLTECDSVPERPPSLGLSVKRSRTNPPSESTQEMLHYLDTHHKLFQKTRNLYSQALPSLLGVGVEEVTNTSDELEGVGFSPEVVDRLLSAFPHILEVNFENVYKVFTVLRKYLRHDNRVYGLILSHPFLFTLDPSQIRETLETLAGLGLGAKELHALFTHHPLLFFLPLTEQTLARIKQTQEAGLSSRWLSSALMYNMHFRPPRAEFGPNAAMVTKLLSSYHVDVGDVLIKYPDLFTHSHDQLLVLIKTLCGDPLYLNKEDVGKMFTQVPEVVCQLDDMDALRAHLSLLCELFTAYVLRIKLFSVKLLLDYRYNTMDKLRTLAEAGFDRETVSVLVNNSPSVLVQQDLEERIRLLLDIPKTTHNQIAESARACLQHHLPSLQARIKFAIEYKSEILCGDQLETLFATSDMQFADLCGHKVDSYYSQTGYVPLVQKKRGRPRKSTPKDSLKSTESAETIQPSAPQAQHTYTKRVSLDSIFTTAEAPDSATPPSDVQSMPNLTFDDIVSDDNSPEELSNVQLSPESIPFDSMEDSKGDESFDSADSIVNKDMEELLHQLRAATFTKDPLFDGSAVSFSTRGGESMDEHLFWEYDGLEDDLYEQPIAQQSVT